QKSKNMVSKSRYVIISEKIGFDKNKALEKILERANFMKTQIENMLGGSRFQLHAKVLKNEELFKLLYASIDYQSAQINTNVKLNKKISLPITFSERELKEIKNEWEESKQEKII